MSNSAPAVAIVTGAAGALGQAVVRRLVQAGYRVAAFERTQEQALAAVEDLDENADRVMAVGADQTSRVSLETAFARVSAELGAPRVLVANAGYAKFGAFTEMDPKTFERHVAVNLTGTFHVCQLAARQMIEARQGGSIVVMSSNLAHSHSDMVGAYCTTKAALIPLVRTMAAELGVHRIRANAILPGVIETAMTEPMLAKPGVRNDLLGETPLGRLGSPEDVADAVEFLTSGKSAWITGSALTLDGGQSIYGQPQWMRQDRSKPFSPQWLAALGAPEASETEGV